MGPPSYTKSGTFTPQFQLGATATQRQGRDLSRRRWRPTDKNSRSSTTMGDIVVEVVIDQVTSRVALILIIHLVVERLGIPEILGREISGIQITVARL